MIFKLEVAFSWDILQLKEHLVPNQVIHLLLLLIMVHV